MTLTVAEIAERTGLDKKAAYSLVSVLLALDAIQARGVRRTRGKVENVYVLAHDAEARLRALATKLITAV